MRSEWDQQGRAGENADYIVRVRETPYGLVLTTTHLYSGRHVHCRLVPRRYWAYMCRHQRKDLIMSFFKKPVPPKGEKGFAPDPVDEGFRKKYPTLWMFLSAGAWPDGEMRKRSSLSIFSDDGMVKGVLNEKEANVSLWASAPTFTGLLEALEARLTEDRPEWRANKEAKKK